MLINRSYFVGRLSITNLNLIPIQQRVDYFIEKYEPELLREILGYALYNAFINGILINPVDQRWTDLLIGKEYTAIDGMLQKWDGLVTIPQGVPNMSYSYNPITVIVGRGNTYDPISGSNSTIIPASVVGKPFDFEQRFYGPLRADEYSVTGNVLTLLNGAIFSSGDTYFYNTSPLSFATVTTTGNRSLIANYVYFMYMQDQATQSSAIGEVEPASANSTRTAPATKMAEAWNEMSHAIHAMWHFLNSNKTVYPEWVWCAKTWSNYRTTNVFGI